MGTWTKNGPVMLVAGIVLGLFVGLNIKVAKAPYWRAYKITYLTGERVKVASSDVVRIDEYQELAAKAGPDLVTIQEQPCPGGTKVKYWYLCKELR